MAAHSSDSEEEDFVTYGKPLEPLEEGEPAKKPIPIQEQTVKDEKGRYKRFHGAFTGGFSAGYYNTAGSKEGWTPSAFVSSRQGKAERPSVHKRPEDFMDDEDLGEHGIAPKEIMTTDDFASKAKHRITEKARQLSSLTAPIPGATILQDLIAAAAKISIGVHLLRKMGWKEGQGVGPRTKRKPIRQRPEQELRVYGCSLPPAGSEGSEDEDDEYQPENVTFAPKDVIPIDFTLKDNVQGLGYKGIDPLRAFFGSSHESLHVFTDGSEKTSTLIGDVRQSKGRKLGITGQAFGVGALEEDDDDIYGTDFLSKYDTVIKDEDPGDGLFGWTAPKEYKKQKGLQNEIRYVGKILEGFTLASMSSAPKKIYLPPDLPKDYRPVHYFRPVLPTNNENSQALQVMLKSSEKPQSDIPQQSRHQLSSSQRRDLLGETSLQGPTSVLELLSEKDKERIIDVKKTVELQKVKAKELALQALKSRFQSANAEPSLNNCQSPGILPGAIATPSDFQPFTKNPEKQQRYTDYIGKLKEGKKDALETSSDPNMTEWERRREQDEFMRAAVLYKSSSSTLSCRFTRAKYEEDTEKVEVARDMEGDVNDKAAAVKMKMFGKLTRDKFEWHPEKLLCKRFNIPDPYPGSTIVGLPKVKRDKYSVFNFLTVPETPSSLQKEIKSERVTEWTNENKTKKTSRWDVSGEEGKNNSISEFLSLARSELDHKKKMEPLEDKEQSGTAEQTALKAEKEGTDQKQEEELEESRPSMDLFKAIFASSSDEKSSSDEDSEEEELKEELSVEPEAPNNTVPNVNDARTAASEPAEPFVPPTKCTQEVDSSDEFGPKLPPVLPYASQTARPASSTEAPQKQKHKKKKDKHKTKKDHKPKKEKKKKNKKQKHKSKQKNKKAEGNSSDTSESSGNQSEAEEAMDISPQELLRRLKRLSNHR
ncbi:G patch domain-containing protein 1 isoform X2 [Ambystoma mexicanum]|uniref:G patch domain-containing protein 1 isoform X2 n=1 Tax=Ambystoma mexicanum TaxID=8296 RepID=UPI0037E78500